MSWLWTEDPAPFDKKKSAMELSGNFQLLQTASLAAAVKNPI